jgi:UDP-2,4-diacetamido-2,4,6-trideoxy-beta-L-altropyranose hydrolase
MPSPHAIFRCDAAPSIGAGHVTRCLALAEALSENGWDIGFVVGADTPSIVSSLAESDFNIRELAAGECELQAMRPQACSKADLVVVDHYQRDRQFETQCRSFARKILVFDDITSRAHDCDFLVDAASIDATDYVAYVPRHTAVLTGPAYAVVRKPFALFRDQALARRDGRPVKSILVSFGATDPADCTGAALSALDAINDDAKVTVVLSSQAPHLDVVRGRLRGGRRLLLDVEADHMAELMTEADLAIGAPGASAFERAALGLPSIIVTFADNQRAIARMMADAGAAAHAGEIDRSTVSRLQTLVKYFIGNSKARFLAGRAGATLVDVQGSSRIVQAIG